MKRALLLAIILINYSLFAQTPNADFSANQTTVCAGGAVTFTNLSTNSNDYAWSFPGGTPGSSTNTNPVITYNTPGTYTVVLTSSNGSNSDTEIKSNYITVVANASITLSPSSPGGAVQTVCENQAISTIVYDIVAATGVIISAGSMPPGVNGVFSSSPSGGTYTISGTPTAFGTYNFTLQTTGGGCAGQTTNVSITVEAPHTLSLTSGSAAQDVCNGSPITNLEYTFGGGATGTTVTPSLASFGLTASTSGSVTTISGTPNFQGTENFSIQTIGNGCPSQTLNFSITVNPTLELVSALSTDTQQVCQNVAIQNIVFEIGGGATGVSTNPALPLNGLTGNFSNPTFTISGTPSAAGVFDIEVSTTGGACPPLTYNIQVEVLPDHVITLTSGNNNQTRCENDPITDITYTLSGGATGATVTGLPAGITGSVSGNVLTISGASNIVGNHPFNITTVGNACAVATASGSITINSSPGGFLFSAAGTDTQDVCQGNAIVNIVYEVNASTTGYTISGLPNGVTNVQSGNQITISGTPTDPPGNYPFTLSLLGPPCPDSIFNGMISIIAPHTLTVDNPALDTQSICLNTPITDISYTFGGGATSASALPLPTGISETVTAPNLVLSGTIAATGTYNLTISTVPNACPSVSTFAQIVVEDRPTLVNNSGNANQTACQSAALTDIVFTMGGDADTITVSPLPGGVSANFNNGVLTLSGSIATAGIYPYSVTASGGPCPDSTINGTIIVEEPHTLVVNTLVTDTQTVCVNSPISNISYTFGGSATSLTTTPALPAGITENTVGNNYELSGTPSAAGIYNLAISTTPTACPSVSLSAQITVESGPELTLNSGNANQTLCRDSILQNIVFTMGGDADTIIATSLPPGTTASFSGGVLTISGPVVAPGNYTYFVTATGSACPDSTISGNIVVQSPAQITLSSAPATANQSICLNTPITNIEYTISGSATGVDMIGEPAGISINLAGNIATISGSPAATGTYNISVFTIGGTCLPDTAYCTIVVSDVNGIVLSSGINSDQQTLCENSPLGLLTYTTSGATSSVNLTGQPAGVSGSLSGTTYTISGTPTVAGPYNYTVTAQGGACPDSVLSGTITVEPSPTLTLTTPVNSDNQAHCQGTAIDSIRYTVGGSATGAASTTLPAGIILTSNGAVWSVTGTPSAPGIYNFNIYTTGGTCVPDTAYISIQVDAPATLTLTSPAGSNNPTVCENEPMSNIIYTTGGGPYTLVNLSGQPTGVNASTSGNTISVGGTPTGTGSFNYTLTLVSANCPDVSQTGTITVDPAPTVVLSSAAGSNNQSVCINSAISNITYTIGGSATGANSSGLPTGVTGSFSGGVYTISGTPSVSGTFNYAVFTVGGPCISDTAYGVIQVNAPPTLALTSAAGSDNQTICSNQPIGAIQYSISGSFVTASATGLPPGVTGTLTGSQFNITGSPTASGTYNYTVTVQSSTCSNVTATGTINVQSGITLQITGGQQNQTVCVSNPVVNTTYTYGGAANNISIIGLPPGVSGSVSGNNLLISGSPNTLGVYNYTVSASGGGCPVVDSTGTIEVIDNSIQLTSAPYTNDQTVCIGSSIDTIVYEVTGSVSVNDLPPGATYTVTGSNPSILKIFGVPTGSGAFFYTVNLNSICGASTVVGNIDVIPSLSANSSGSNMTVCEGTNFTIVGSTMTSSNFTLNYLWQHAPSAAGPFTNAPVPNNQSNYSTSLLTNSPNKFFRRVVFVGSCSDTGNVVQITVNAKPQILATGSTTICSNDTLTVPNMFITNGFVSSWSTAGSGQLFFANTPNPVYLPGPSDAGTTVDLNFLVYSNNACAPMTINGTFIVNVKADPVAETAGLVEVCAYNAEVNMSGLVLNGSANWLHDGLGQINNPNSLYATYTTSPFDAGDTVKVYLTATSQGCTYPIVDSSLFTIVVKADGSDPTIQLQAGPDTTIYLGSSYQLNATGNAVQQWIWTPGYALDDSTIFNPIARPEVTVTYVVTAVNIKGCLDRDTVVVTVSEDPVVSIPNLFSPNGDGFNDLFVIPELDLYPNTALTIINREGVVVYESKNYKNDWDGNFRGQKLPEATYYYLIEFEKGDKKVKGPITILRNED